MIREETLMADIDEILMSAEERMEKAITALKENFMGVRTGRANAMVLDRIKVDYYGVPTPVNPRPICWSSNLGTRACCVPLSTPSSRAIWA